MNPAVRCTNSALYQRPCTMLGLLTGPAAGGRGTVAGHACGSECVHYQCTHQCAQRICTVIYCTQWMHHAMCTPQSMHTVRAQQMHTVTNSEQIPCCIVAINCTREAHHNSHKLNIAYCWKGAIVPQVIPQRTVTTGQRTLQPTLPVQMFKTACPSACTPRSSGTHGGWTGTSCCATGQQAGSTSLTAVIAGLQRPLSGRLLVTYAHKPCHVQEHRSSHD
jgi:hypothetical protein